MARDCTSDRVLLSAHMEEHWVKVGYRPDTQDLNEVDELDVQIGRKEPEPAPADSLRPDHTEKYTSVLINGFSKIADEKDIYNILLEGGLPTEYEISKIKKNEKNGQLQIENLDSTVCVSLTDHIHSKKFFNRKVFVTSVVQKSPVKVTDVTEDNEALANDDKSCPDPNGFTVSSEADSSDSETEDPSTTAKPPCSKLFSTISDSGKRPATASPEGSSENAKKDKKLRKKANANASTAVRSSSRHGPGQTTNK